MRTLEKTIIVCICLSLFAGYSCVDQKAMEELQAFQSADSIEADNIQHVKELYQLLDEQNLEEFTKRFAAEAKGYMGSSEEPFNFEEIIPFIKMYYSAFPDYTHHIENIFAAGDYVVVQLKYTGTHENEFMDIPPTGNEISYKGIFIMKMKDGKVVESWGLEDDLTLMNQLGSGV